MRFSTVAAAVLPLPAADNGRIYRHATGSARGCPGGRRAGADGPATVFAARRESRPAAPSAPPSGDAAAKHAKRTACLKDAKTKKLVGADKTAFPEGPASLGSKARVSARASPGTSSDGGGPDGSLGLAGFDVPADLFHAGVGKRPQAGFQAAISRHQPGTKRCQDDPAAAAAPDAGMSHGVVEAQVHIFEQQPRAPIAHPHLARGL